MRKIAAQIYSRRSRRGRSFRRFGPYIPRFAREPLVEPPFPGAQIRFVLGLILFELFNFFTFLENLGDHQRRQDFRPKKAHKVVRLGLVAFVAVKWWIGLGSNF
jgi:hypothetical protein